MNAEHGRVDAIATILDRCWNWGHHRGPATVNCLGCDADLGVELGRAVHSAMHRHQAEQIAAYLDDRGAQS